MEVTLNGTYSEPGATATDNIDGVMDPATKITITGTVNTSVVGQYRVLYKATDAAGNTGTKTRIVNVVTTP
jgi:hypothetical protein